MAKSETNTVKKPKGKKRKHSNAETEDEIANKSVIVENNTPDELPTESVEESITKKTKKRKNKENGAILEKRSKTSQKSGDKESDNDDYEVNDLIEPSLEELKESEKKENKLAIVSGRQKKKQHRQKIVETQKDQSMEKEKLRNTEYLKKWKHAPKSWKFEKLRQISIQKTMFDIDKMNTDVWPIALEYLAGSRGSAKAKILKLANDAIEDVEKLSEESKTENERQTMLSSIKYQRARDLLQIFE